MVHDTAGLIRFLQEAHAMEVGALETLDAFNVGYATVEASTAVHNYRGTCENQVRVLSTLLEALGARPSGTKNFVGALVGKAADWINVNQGGDERAALLLVRIYGTIQTKGAMYDALAAYADTMHDPEMTKIARDHREQEFAAAEVIFPFIWEAASMEEPNDRAPEFVI